MVCLVLPSARLRDLSCDHEPLKCWQMNYFHRQQVAVIYTVSQKTGPVYIKHNFYTYCPILVILSLLQTEIILYAHEHIIEFPTSCCCTTLKNATAYTSLQKLLNKSAMYASNFIVVTKQTRSPASAGTANRPLVFWGIFLIFGSYTPTWSVENQLHYWLRCGSHFVYGGSTHYTQD